MRIRFDSSSLRQTKWNQYAVRFIFGGLITAAAGVVAKQHGPVIGGLLLAFPAIFPASATLIEKHEKQRKEQNGMNGEWLGAGRPPVWMPPVQPWEVWVCFFLPR